MPGKVKVKIISGKNLPVMDRSSDTTDAYVEIKLGNITYKTDVCRRTLHPRWNTDWYRFELDDSELQDEPLQIRVMDHDTYSANDAIGKVYLNLNPLLLPAAGQLAVGDNNPHHEISGWIPVYDTMHGIRGEVNVTVKVELFSDFNRFRQSSCGIHFFYSSNIPQGYQIKLINGFVEELIVDDDPEYQWIDKIRTPRASNEARQTLFFKLSGELQRKIGVKALNLGSNAVIGYKQCFDLEGESGIVARGIGTAVTLVKFVTFSQSVPEAAKDESASNYLNFVGDGKSFSLRSSGQNRNAPFKFSDPCLRPKSIQCTSTRIPKKLSKRLYTSLDSSSISTSVSNPSLYEDHTSLKTLLSQEDKRGESVMSRRFQKFKRSQKSLSRKMTALRAKLGDGIGEEADEDTSVTSTEKRKFFKRATSESSVMAEMLARSVLQATNSLTCVLEMQNPPKEDDTMKKLEPLSKLLSQSHSQSSILEDNMSELQSDSSSDTSSSCSDFEYDKSNNDLETISNVISNIEKLQKCLPREGLQKQYSLPTLSTLGYSFESDLDCIGKNKKVEQNENLTFMSKFVEDYKEINSNVNEKRHDQYSGNGKAGEILINDSHSCDDDKLIASVNFDKVDVEPKRLVKTAMQTMLLEKVNIIGAYSPPTSPSLVGNFAFNDVSEQKKGFIPKSASASSFSEYAKQIDTVLGIPFQSLATLKTEYLKHSQPCLSSPCHVTIPRNHTYSCFSDSDLHQPKITLSQEKETITKNKFKFLHMKIGSHDHNKHRKNILSRMLNIKHEINKLTRDQETQTSREILNTPCPFQFPPTNYSNTSYEIQHLHPGNTEIDSGVSHAHSTTKLACITSNRQTHSSAQESNGTGGGSKEEDVPEANKLSHSPVKISLASLHRRSSDSDLSVTPKGGAISARSVKLLERITNVEEPESRDSWWSELRMEIRSHARTLNCNAVLGYTESASICEDVCVLSACGTAALIDFNNCSGSDDDNLSNAHLLHRSLKEVSDKEKCSNGFQKSIHDSPDHVGSTSMCAITHLPYDEKTVPVNAKVLKCPMCFKSKVPEVLIATIEPIENIPNVGKGCFIESHVSRPLKDVRGEYIAREISDGLPFLEYELHRVIVNKLKIKGMNAIFSLNIRISIGEKMLIGVATGTAIYLSSLPPPVLPLLVSDRVSDEKIVAGLQEMLNETIKKNREIYEIKNDSQNNKYLSDEDSDEEQASLDVTCANKDCSILEMDDPEDAEVVNLLMEEKVPDGFHVVNTESVPGLDDLEIVKNLQMFIQIYRAKFVSPYNLQKHFVRLQQSIYFKLRRMIPCALCDLQFRVDLPESDEIQLCVIGMALGLGKKTRLPGVSVQSRRAGDEDLIFKLDEDSSQDASHISKSNQPSLKHRSNRSPSKYRSQSLKQRHIPNKEMHGVDITPLSYVPGGNIEQYLGNLNFFFIRETTSIREEGGSSGFIHSFITEVLAIVRSHVTALGGNALVAFFITECVLNHNLHKNQGQCLINVGGDVVSVSYYKEEV
ncbi:C2 domain-containing protein 5 isoform X2 [Cylas formicarius]|uniref:C2 domain-containing protein 5 isoform X2 n=1 Tax=Cylas formicarius TaxID=197179 RepID=UPI0029589CF8|nr:C2 domain-containing protein 5 isoform X2 [Cylas formicarius]